MGLGPAFTIPIDPHPVAPDPVVETVQPGGGELRRKRVAERAVNPRAAQVHGCTGDVSGPGSPADPVPCFDDRDFGTGGHEIAGRGQPGDTCAHDDDTHRARVSQTWTLSPLEGQNGAP